MSIIQRVPWRVQPQYPVEPNRASSLMRGMLGLYVPTKSVKNLVGKLGNITKVGTPTTTPSNTGVGYYGGSSSNYWALPDLYGSTHDGVGTGEVTMIAIVKSNTTGNQSFPIQTTDKGDNEHYFFSSVIYASTFHNSGRWISGVASKVTITNEHVICIRSRSGEKNFYQNGILLAATTGTTYTYNTNVGPILGKSQASGFDGPVLLVGVLDRYISDAELSVLRSPASVYGELLAPLPRRIWAPAAAGGGTTDGAFSSDGTATAIATGASIAAGAANSVGAATGEMVGGSIAAGAFNSAGAATGDLVGTDASGPVSGAAYSAAGATAEGVGASIAAGAANASGTATGEMVGSDASAATEAYFESSGTATAIAVGASIAAASAYSAGSASAIMVGTDAAAVSDASLTWGGKGRLRNYVLEDDNEILELVSILVPQLHRMHSQTRRL